MTPPPEADETGSAVQSAGPVCPLPYNPETIISELGLDAGLRVELPVGRVATLPFYTQEGDWQQNNTIKFQIEAPIILDRQHVYDALRGDVDSVEMTEYRTRIIHVAMPRLGAEGVRRAAAAEAWREHMESFEERVREWAHAREVARVAQLAEQAKREVAVEVARQTLMRYLNEEQRASVDKHGHFEVLGSEGTLYRIGTWSYSGNVSWREPVPDRRFKTGFRYEEGGRFCAHCAPVAGGWLPVADHNLSQALELRLSEVEWLNVAVLNGGDMPPSWYRSRTREQIERWAYEEKDSRKRRVKFEMHGGALPEYRNAGEQTVEPW